MTVAERTGAPAATDASTAAAIGRALEEALEPLLAEARARDGETLVSATIAVAAHDAVGMFATAQRLGAEPALWSQPDEAFSMLALEVAWRVRASGAARFEVVEMAWAELGAGALVSGPADTPGTGPLLLGGLGFSDAAAASATWAGYEAADMVLPRLLLTSSPGGAWLTLNAIIGRSGGATAEVLAARAAQLWQELRAASTSGLSPGEASEALRTSRSTPEASEWRATVARFAGAVGRGRIDKVVLSRRIEVVADERFDVGAVVARLTASAPESTVFAITRGARTFVGATPERLVKLSGLDFQTVALAGSARRAADPEGDSRIAGELLRSDKEREEHAVVVHMLRDTLAPLAVSLAMPDEPSIRRFRHVQHLATEVSGRLREPIGVLALVARLHPTPAVGGAPADLALELIAEEERHDRGWYAGPLGWLDREGNGEFVVALRCGLLEGARATLFAGCGIVADSDPDREWAESLMKLRAFGSALGRIEA